MNASDLLQSATRFQGYYLYSDLHSEVKFGCDCGCGGDSYTSEQWDEMVQDSKEAYNEFKAVCEKLNIEWDYE